MSDDCTICNGEDHHENGKCEYCDGTGTEKSKQDTGDAEMCQAVQDDYNEIHNEEG